MENNTNQSKGKKGGGAKKDKKGGGKDKKDKKDKKKKSKADLKKKKSKSSLKKSKSKKSKKSLAPSSTDVTDATSVDTTEAETTAASESEPEPPPPPPPPVKKPSALPPRRPSFIDDRHKKIIFTDEMENDRNKMMCNNSDNTSVRSDASAASSCTTELEVHRYVLAMIGVIGLAIFIYMGMHTAGCHSSKTPAYHRGYGQMPYGHGDYGHGHGPPPYMREPPRNYENDRPTTIRYHDNRNYAKPPCPKRKKKAAAPCNDCD